MEGHKNSFEYVQDYIGINGIKMWQVRIFKILLCNNKKIIICNQN